jgi:hypothetical protein
LRRSGISNLQSFEVADLRRSGISNLWSSKVADLRRSEVLDPRSSRSHEPARSRNRKSTKFRSLPKFEFGGRSVWRLPEWGDSWISKRPSQRLHLKKSGFGVWTSGKLVNVWDVKDIHVHVHTRNIH